MSELGHFITFLSDDGNEAPLVADSLYGDWRKRACDDCKLKTSPRQS